MRRLHLSFSLILSLFVVAAFIGTSWAEEITITGEKILPPEPIVPLSLIITNPTGEPAFTAHTQTLKIGGFASENIATISWQTDKGHNGQMPGKTEWSIEGIPLESGDNEIIVTGSDNKGNSVTDTTTVTYNAGFEFSGPVIINPDEIFVDEETEIIARVSIAPNPEIDPSGVELIELCENGSIKDVLGHLTDNGDMGNGDEVGSDNIWSCKFMLREPAKGRIYTRVAVDTLDGDSAPDYFSEKDYIDILEHINDDDAKFAIGFPDVAMAKYEELKAVYGEDEARLRTLAWVQEQPEIAEAGISAGGRGGIWWVYRSGIEGGLMLYTPGEKGSKSRTDE